MFSSHLAQIDGHLLYVVHVVEHLINHLKWTKTGLNRFEKQVFSPPFSPKYLLPGSEPLISGSVVELSTPVLLSLA
jgi:hypothetical protein